MFEILEKAKAGDVAAIEQICETAEGIVAAQLSSMRVSINEVDDLRQDALLDVARDLHACRASSVGEFVKWVNVLTRHAVCDHREKLGALKRTCPTALVSRIDIAKARSRDPSELAEISEAWKQVDGMLDPGSQTHTAVHMLAEGYSFAEIVSQLGSTPAAVYGVVKRFRNKLAQAGITAEVLS